MNTAPGKSVSIEGRDLSEYVRLTTTNLPQMYTVGTAANGAMLGSWPLEGSLPQEGHRFKFYAAVDTLVAFVPLWMFGRQNMTPPTLPPLPALPLFQLVPKSTFITFDVKAIFLWIRPNVLDTNGNLDIWIEG